MARSNISTEARVDAALQADRLARELHDVRMHQQATIGWQIVAMLRNAHVNLIRVRQLLDEALALPVSEPWSLARVRVRVAACKEALRLPIDAISAEALAADRSDERNAFRDYVRSLTPPVDVALALAEQAAPLQQAAE